MSLPAAITAEELAALIAERDALAGALRVDAGWIREHSRIGGLAQDATPKFIEMTRQFLKEVPKCIDEVDKLLTRNKIFLNRTRGVGVLSKEDALDYGVSGPCLRGSGIEFDLRLLDAAGGSVRTFEDYGRTYLPDGSQRTQYDVALMLKSSRITRSASPT